VKRELILQLIDIFLGDLSPLNGKQLTGLWAYGVDVRLFERGSFLLPAVKKHKLPPAFFIILIPVRCSVISVEASVLCFVFNT
jgi:hypothetical protein